MTTTLENNDALETAPKARSLRLHPHDTSYVPLSLDQAFENYLIAKRDHDRECDLARQNYGGWNFTASTRNKLTNAEQYLRWTFNR